MAGKPIEATLRIAAEVAQAIKALKSVRQELVATSKAAAGAGTGTSAGAAGAAGTAATADATQVVGALKRRTAAETEAAAQSKRLAKEESDRQKAAALEAKKLAGEEEARRKKSARETERAAREQELAAKKSARAAAGQRGQLSPQLNDIFVGLTTGQNPLTVALQQGPQITQIYGGVTNTLRAALSVLTPLRVALGVAAGGFALLATQIAAGYRESSQLNKALALSGNIAGTSLAQISGLAKTISAETGTSVSFVREVLAEVITIGGQTSTTLGATTRAVVALSKLTGQSADEAAKGFAEQADGVTQFATKANKAYNFLTADQVAYIKTLERQGRTAEAIKFTNEQLAGTLEQRSVPAIGSLERGWRDVGSALSTVLDKLKEIGRDETAEAKIKQLQERAAGTGGQLPFKTIGEAFKFGLFGGNATETGRNFLAELQARNEAERDAAQLQFNHDAKRREEEKQRKILEQQKTKQATSQFQQLEANQKTAIAQKELAQTQADLDAEQALVERARAAELIAERDQARKLNAIEQQRAAAQLKAIAEQIEAQGAVKGNTPEDVKAEAAQMSQLESQRIAAKARFDTAVAQARTLFEGELTKLDLELASRRAENSGADAPQQKDPTARAQQAAQAATAEARRQLDDLNRQFEVRKRTIGGGPEAAAILARDRSIIEEAQKTLADQTRRAELDDLFRQGAEQQSALAIQLKAVDELVRAGTLTATEGEHRKDEARKAALPALREIIRLERERQKNPEDKNKIDDEEQRINEVSAALARLEEQTREGGISALRQLFNDISTGAKSGKEALLDMVKGFGQALLNLINQRLAEKLFKQLEGLGDSGSGGYYVQFLKFLGSIGSTSAGVKHDGGLIGAAGLSRTVGALAFAGAQVLHSGGLVGMTPNERPVIAEVGEEMLTADDPRHVKNFRGAPVIGAMTISVNVSVADAVADEAQRAQQLAAGMKAVVETYVTEQMRQGGIFSRR